MTDVRAPSSCPPQLDAGPPRTSSAGREWQEGGATHVDVRGLAPPQPLVAILRLVRAAPAGAAIVAHLDRDPVMLYPELAELGWEAVPQPAEPPEVCLLLRPVA